MSNNDSYYNKILGESFELAVKNKNLKSKEYNITKENELLKARVKELEEKLKIAEEETQYCSMCEEWAEKYDQLKAENDELKKKCNIYTCGICGNKEDCNKLYKILIEIKPILKLYANSKIGEEQLDGTYKIVLGGSYLAYYDPKPAKQALQKISEVENV